MARFQSITKLSNSILEMKFMKRTKEKVEQEREDAEGREMYSHEITREMKQGAGSFIIEPSFAACEDLLVGRLSYRGMNPEIERILELERAEEEVPVNETDVTDTEMASFYNPLVKSMKSKFKTEIFGITRSSEHGGQESKPKIERHKRKHSPDKSEVDEVDNTEQNSPVHHKHKKYKFETI